MSKPENKMFLLDAMALIYRAHFAFSKNPRINSKGVNTGAALGFTNTLVEILNKEKPTHIAVAFDTSAPTFRHERFPEYKAQREEQPEDIRVAIPVVKDIVRAFNIPVIEKDGFEADDLIGTIAHKAGDAGFEVFMMTPDKDYGQLVREHVYLYKPSFMGNGVDVLGIPEVLQKWDIERVDQVADMLGLQGDSVDNIPGIPGIGPKTAAKLLKKYGTVEELVKNYQDLKGKQKENVEKYADQAILSKELATINTEVPVHFDPDSCKCSEPDEKEINRLFEELEFRTLARRVLGQEIPKSKSTRKVKKDTAQMGLFGSEEKEEEEDKPASEAAPETAVAISSRNTIYNTPHHYHLVEEEEKLKELAVYLGRQKEFCFDTETDSLDAHEAELVGLSFSYVAGEAYYVPVPDDRDGCLSIVAFFREVLENPDVIKIGQNLKYDMLVLKRYGVEVKGTLFDTMIAHYLLEPDMRHNMDVLAESILNYTPVSIETLIGKKGKKQGSMRDAEVEKVAEYAGEDADITLQLKLSLEKDIKKHNLDDLLLKVESPLTRVLADMEAEGVKIDTETLQSYSKALEKESVEIEKRIYELAGEEFNIASTKQLGPILFEKLQIDTKPKKTKTGLYATGEEVLVKYANEHEIVRLIQDYRELNKLKSTYVDALPLLISPRTGLIHTNYNQAVAATGRLSSTNPNLQNIPIRTDRGREIRRAFVPRSEEYTLMAADYSQIELRIMAAFSEDESMIDAFKNGRDIHATTASKIYKVPLEEVDSDMRRKAKTANFGIIYGISAFGLSQRLDIPRGEASDIINAYFEEFPAVKEYMDRVVNDARSQEYVETILNRRRYLRDINSRNATIRGYAERNAINAPIQGSAADIIKIAMINIYDWMKKEKLKSKMIMQVHDELVFDVHLEEKELMEKQVVELMKNAHPLSVPMEIGVGFGSNWLEAH
ncbi:DNA polymerase I [Roseivirga sp. BDSF3-8]|uniref:DNA polymerase I n=1 Tax=Roseivirga sp. BDSF3-8 TaxID=3241598 RepID=UPI0035317FB6